MEEYDEMAAWEAYCEEGMREERAAIRQDAEYWIHDTEAQYVPLD